MFDTWHRFSFAHMFDVRAIESIDVDRFVVLDDLLILIEKWSIMNHRLLMKNILSQSIELIHSYGSQL